MDNIEQKVAVVFSTVSMPTSVTVFTFEKILGDLCFTHSCLDSPYVFQQIPKTHKFFLSGKVFHNAVIFEKDRFRLLLELNSSYHSFFLEDDSLLWHLLSFVEW